MYKDGKQYDKFILNGKTYDKFYLNNKVYGSGKNIVFVPPNNQQGYLRNNGTIILSAGSKYYEFINTEQFTKVKYKGFLTVTSDPPNFASIIAIDINSVVHKLLGTIYYENFQTIVNTTINLPSNTVKIVFGWGDYAQSAGSTLELTLSN